jgi:ankyrin repeat protein
MSPDTLYPEPLLAELRTAIDTGDLTTVKRLLETEPDLLNAIIRPGKNRDYRPLTEAAVECQLDILAFLIASGADVTEDGHYPLFRASLYDRCVPALEMLVRHGADINAVWDDWGPPLRAACEGMAPACLSWLLKHGARIAGSGPGATKEVSWNALVDAVYYHKRCPELLQTLLAHGGDVNSRGAGGDTALHVAARRGDVAGVRFLLQRGADPGLPDDASRRPIQVTRNKQVTKLLEGT